MKKYKIKYQKGDDICIMYIYQESKCFCELEFYMQNPTCDILEIEEVTA